MRSFKNVFEWLDQVRARPGMYFNALSELESMIWGYVTALEVHRIDEDVPSMRHFNDWLRFSRRWSMNAGWAYAITHRSKDADDARELFFALVDKYRRLRPTLRAMVQLTARHRRTGKRVIKGGNSPDAAPERIEIRQLAPAPLHYLKLIHAEHDAIESLSIGATGGTTLEAAKRWVQDEYGVAPDEWEVSAAAGGRRGSPAAGGGPRGRRRGRSRSGV
jgi:hypothetical protein